MHDKSRNLYHDAIYLYKNNFKHFNIYKKGNKTLNFNYLTRTLKTRTLKENIYFH